MKYWEAKYAVAEACERLDALLSEAVAALRAEKLSAQQRRRVVNRLLREMGQKPLPRGERT